MHKTFYNKISNNYQNHETFRNKNIIPFYKNFKNCVKKKWGGMIKLIITARKKREIKQTNRKYDKEKNRIK